MRSSLQDAADQAARAQRLTEELQSVCQTNRQNAALQEAFSLRDAVLQAAPAKLRNDAWNFACYQGQSECSAVGKRPPKGFLPVAAGLDRQTALANARVRAGLPLVVEPGSWRHGYEYDNPRLEMLWAARGLGKLAVLDRWVEAFRRFYDGFNVRGYVRWAAARIGVESLLAGQEEGSPDVDDAAGMAESTDSAQSEGEYAKGAPLSRNAAMHAALEPGAERGARAAAWQATHPPALCCVGCPADALVSHCQQAWPLATSRFVCRGSASGHPARPCCLP